MTTSLDPTKVLQLAVSTDALSGGDASSLGVIDCSNYVTHEGFEAVRACEAEWTYDNRAVTIMLLPRSLELEPWQSGEPGADQYTAQLVIQPSRITARRLRRLGPTAVE